jgi:hypothetical protein
MKPITINLLIKRLKVVRSGMCINDRERMLHLINELENLERARYEIQASEFRPREEVAKKSEMLLKMQNEQMMNNKRDDSYEFREGYCQALRWVLTDE